MTKKEYVDILQLEISGGAVTDEPRVDYRSMGALLDIAREKAIGLYVVQKGGLPAQLFQTTFPVFKKDVQEDDCNTIFEIPSPVIQSDQATSAMSYIGGESGKDPYIRSSDRASFANQMQHYLMASIASKKPVALYIPEFSYVKINKTPGNLPKRIMVTGVFVNPSSIPEYNESIDDYPITNEIFSLAKEYIMQADVRQILGTTPNTISNSADDGSVLSQGKR